jgi:hypothetical protein
MEEQIPVSQVPQQSQGISPEQLAEMKARAREQAIRMSLQQQPPGTEGYLRAPEAPVTLPGGYFMVPENPEPKIVYVRRNMTVAEILVMTVLSCVIVGGIQGVWNFTSKYLPQIEVRVK